MNQIMPIGKGVLIAIEGKMTLDRYRAFTEAWRERLPGVPGVVIDNARIVLEGEITMFQFTGDVSPTMVAEFQRWWEGVTNGGG